MWLGWVGVAGGRLLSTIPQVLYLFGILSPMAHEIKLKQSMSGFPLFIFCININLYRESWFGRNWLHEDISKKYFDYILGPFNGNENWLSLSLDTDISRGFGSLTVGTTFSQSQSKIHGKNAGKLIGRNSLYSGHHYLIPKMLISFEYCRRKFLKILKTVNRTHVHILPYSKMW